MSSNLEELLEMCTYNSRRRKIVSIDIGIIHMGIVSCWTEDRDIDSVELCQLINIKQLSETCCCKNCKLSHEANVIDWVAHFVQKFKNELDSCDTVLIEKQPPGGIQHVETLLIKEYRSKVISIYPISLHKFMNVGGMDYEDRKKVMERKAQIFLRGHKDWENTEFRKHDMADALCFIKYYLETADYSVFPLPLLGNAEPIESFRYHK